MSRTLVAGLTALVLTACASADTSSSESSADGQEVTVMAAFYPLQFAAEQVGGDAVTVVGLTPAGAEPHDVELSPQQVAELGEADLILYIKGFQPAVDQAVEQVGADRAVDVSAGIPLIGNDPHIWLDPQNMVTIAGTVEGKLAQVAPGGAETFARNADDLDGQLTALDRQWAQQTAKCSSRDLVVSHEAFGYLAARYDFTQVGISGLSPEAEPSPGKVAEVTDFVRSNDVRTIYFETLVDPKVAETVAAETGARTAVLDPLEGLPAGSDQNYLTVMDDNLATVVKGQPCP